MIVAAIPSIRTSPRHLIYSFATMCSPDSPASTSKAPSSLASATIIRATNALLTALTPPYGKRLVFLFLLIMIPILLYACSPGLRRTCQFWSAMAPTVLEYKLLQLRNKLDQIFSKTSCQKRQDERIQQFHMRTAPRITNKMVELGGIYIKLGQVLSTVGSGFLDESYVQALRPLQDGVPPRDYTQISSIIESSTGKSMEDLFQDFEEHPIGAASIAQAHRAVLKNTNEQVVVKVQYPQVARLFEIDFDNLETAVKWLDPANVELVQALRKRHELEMDFTREANNLVTVRNNLQRHGVEPSRVRIPIVKNETGICNENVLVMEYLEGTSLSTAMEQEQHRYAKALGKENADEVRTILMKRMKEHMERGGGAGSGSLQAMNDMNTQLLQAVGPFAARLFRVYAGLRERVEIATYSLRHGFVGGESNETSVSKRKSQTKSRINLGRAIKTLVHVHGLQMIKDGVFNLDCHPGNVLVLPDGRLGLLDYGMVGRLDEEDRMNIAKTVVALSRKDKEEVARIYTDAGYRASWKEGNVTDANIIHRFASFHFDRIDLSNIQLKSESENGKAKSVGVMDILRTTRERSIPFWIEDGRRLGGLLMGTASQAARPISLANEWRQIATQVIRNQSKTKSTK